MSSFRFEGDEVRYEVVGDDGPPLLLVQGLGAPGAMWEAALPWLTGFRCVWYDNPGTGESDAPDDDAAYSIEHMARIAIAVLDEVDWPAAHVWGGSMGSMIALQLALDAPGRIRSLVLAPASASALPVDDDHIAAVRAYADAAATSTEDPLGAARTMIPYWYGDEFLAANPGMDELVAAMFTAHPVRRLPAMDDATGIGSWDVTDRLGEVTAPTLVCHGTRDRLLPVRRAQEVFAGITTAELRLHHAPHSFSIGDRDRIMPEIATWMAAR